MAEARSTRATMFIAGGVLVAAVVASLYFVPARRSAPTMMTDTTVTDPHSEIAGLEELWKAHPNHAPIALQLGNLYAEQNRPDKAIQYYREFLKLDTSATGWEVRLDIAKALYTMGKPADAKSELLWIINRDPDHAGALYNLGAIEANTGNRIQARTYWERLISAHPQDSLAQFARQSLTQLK